MREKSLPSARNGFTRSSTTATAWSRGSSLLKKKAAASMAQPVLKAAEANQNKYPCSSSSSHRDKRQARIAFAAFAMVTHVAPERIFKKSLAIKPASMHVTAAAMSTAMEPMSSSRAMPIKATTGSALPMTDTSTKMFQRNSKNTPIKKLSIAMFAIPIAS
jgi:hypothetical protein